MTYTNLLLVALGILGILLHNFIKMNDLNRKSNGNFSLSRYLRIERFSLVISVIVVICAVLVKSEIAELELAGKWLGFAFITIGYMGQSIVVKFMGRANKMIDGDTAPQVEEKKEPEV